MKTNSHQLTNWIEFIRPRLAAKQPIYISLNSILEITMWKIVLGNLILVEKEPLRWNFVPIPDFALMAESAEGVRRAMFKPGIYSPFQYFLLQLKVAETQTEDSMVSCAMSLQKLLGEIEDQTGFLEWGEIKKGLLHLAASTGNCFFTHLAAVCDVVLKETLQRTVEDEMPPDIIFLIPDGLIGFADQGQPVGIGIDACDDPEKVEKDLKISGHYGDLHCYHEIAAGEQTMHNLECAMLVRRSRCETLPLCWCEPKVKPATHDWYIHHSVEPEGQNPSVQHSSTPTVPPGPGSLAEAALRATNDGDFRRVESVLRRIPKRGSWTNHTVREIVTAGRCVLGPSDDGERIGWGPFHHAKPIMEFVIETVVRQWGIPAAKLLHALASEGMLEIAIYCAGYMTEDQKSRRQIRKAANAASRRGHSHTAGALWRFRCPMSP
jgi:hypothetical protein